MPDKKLMKKTFNYLIKWALGVSREGELDANNPILKKIGHLSGIYMFKCKLTGARYIGSALLFKSRFKGHMYVSQNNSNKNLQALINKNGLDSFEFGVLEFIKLEGTKKEQKVQLEALEQLY